MAALGVIGPFFAHAGNRLIAGDLPQQLGQHGSVPNAVVCHLNGPNPQRLGINAKMRFAPLPAVLGSVFLRFHSSSPKNLMPVLSTSKSNAVLLRWRADSPANAFAACTPCCSLALASLD